MGLRFVICILLASLACHAVGPAAPQVSVPGSSVGASDYQSLGDPRVDPAAFAEALAALGVTFTRVWLIDAWATGTGETGTYEGVLPASRGGDGRWDLFAWSQPYFRRLRAYAEQMNHRGITPVFTLLELYSWSAGKQGLLWVPDQSRGLFRANVNGVRWGPDSDTLDALPDRWLREFSCRVIDTLKGTRFVIEIGNEMPDAAMHDRVLAHLRTTCGYEGEVWVNREHGEAELFATLDVGRRYDRWSIHGATSLAYLDESRGDGPRRTLRALFDTGIDMSRIVVSSDGARASTDVARAYDYAGLTAVATDILGRGGSYEHQLAIKLRRFRDGRYDLADLKYDEAFLRGLAALTR